MQEELETLKESLRFEKQNLVEATRCLEMLRSQYDEKDKEHQVSTTYLASHIDSASISIYLVIL